MGGVWERGRNLDIGLWAKRSEQRKGNRKTVSNFQSVSRFKRTTQTKKRLLKSMLFKSALVLPYPRDIPDVTAKLFHC